MKSRKFDFVLVLWLASVLLQLGDVAQAGPTGNNNFTVLNAGSPGSPNTGPPGVNLIPMKQKMAFVSLESLDAEFFPSSRLVNVKGSLKNISNSTLRGYITISLLSQTGVVLAAFDMQVNDHRPFSDGETVPFDTAVNVSSVSGAFRVGVEFTKD